MRTLVLVVIGCGFLVGALPSRTIYGQDGGIARLSSAAYAPDSPVRENKLFKYQTGHYGFAYNCDGEECKRNNPAICWQKANQRQLPERMGCLERIRHEAAQVSRRILDGSCNSGCESCQQPTTTSTARACRGGCGCGNCSASNQRSEPTVRIASRKNHAVNHARQSNDLPSANNPKVEQAPVIASVLATPPSARRSQSGLMSLTPLESAPQIALNSGEILIGEVEVLPVTLEPAQSTIESVQPPVARITSAVVGSSVEEPVVAEPAVRTSQVDSVVELMRQHTKGYVVEASPPTPPESSQPLTLVERLQKAQSARASDLTKPEKF